MKWSNFLTLIERNPDLEIYIRQHIGPPIMHSMDMSEVSEQQRRQYVEAKVKYIAFRSFDELSLDSRDNVQTVVNFQDKPTNCHFPPRLKSETRIIHKIYYHIAGEEKPFSRMVWVGLGDVDHPERTIRECVEGLIEWHKKYWGKQKDRPLIFDCLVKTSKVWDDLAEGCVSEWHELYRFPTNFLNSLTAEAT